MLFKWGFMHISKSSIGDILRSKIGLFACEMLCLLSMIDFNNNVGMEGVGFVHN